MKATVTAGPGTLVVEIDGQAVPAHRVELRADADPRLVPTLVVYVAKETQVDIEGVIQVVGEPDEDDIREAAANWIAGVDLDGLEALVGPRLVTLASNPIRETVAVLAELIRGGI